MNFEHFLTKKILSAKPYKNSTSAPIIKIGVIAISISMVVMIISVAVGFGMQDEIKEKISSLEGHITIQSFNNSEFENLTNPISADDNFIKTLYENEEIKYLQKVIKKFGIARTKDDFEGVVFKGLESKNDFISLKKFLINGRLPNINNSYSNEILISKSLSEKLKLNLDDSFQMLFSRGNNVQPAIIKLVVCGIYNTGFEELEAKFIFGDIKQIRRINKWNNDQISSIDIHLYNHDNFEEIAEKIYLNSPSNFDVISMKEKYFTIFEWIELFDKNIIAIIFLMLLVASINIITVLIVLIIERTNMIGILKSMGATNFSIRKFFIYISSYLIGIGIIIGNIIALTLIFIQRNYEVFSMDPKIYYVDLVPVNLQVLDLFYLNLLVFTLCVISIFLPSILVTKIRPIKTLKFA